MTEFEEAAEKGSTEPWWYAPLGGCLFVVVLAYVLSYLGGKDTVQSIQATSTVLAALGTLGALLVLIRQFDGQRSQIALQNEALSDQRRAAARAATEQQQQLTLQRLVLDDQRRVLDEQRRTSHLARFDSLRDAYADYLGASMELLSVLVDYSSVATNPAAWVLEAAGRNALLDANRVKVTKFNARLVLHDRSDERFRIRGLVSRALGEARTLSQAFHYARDAAIELRAIANARDPVTPNAVGSVDDWTEALLGFLTDEQLAQITGDALTRVLRVGIWFAQLALRASLAAEETETLVVLPPLPSLEDSVAR